MLTMRCNPLDGGDPVWSAAARAYKPDAPSLDNAGDRAVTNTPRPMSGMRAAGVRVRVW